jgi:hypothetical protein
MQKLIGTKADLEKLAAEVDRVTRVADIPQVNVGGGIHGEPPVLTRGVPMQDGNGKDWVYVVSGELDAKVVTDAVAATKVAVVEKAEAVAEAIK